MLRFGFLLLLLCGLCACQHGNTGLTTDPGDGMPRPPVSADDPFLEPFREGAGLLQGDITLNGTTETDPNYDASPFPISQQARTGDLVVMRIRGRLSNNAATTLYCKTSQPSKNYYSYLVPGTNVDTFRAMYVEQNEPFTMTFYNATNYNTPVNSKAALFNYSFKTSAVENADEPNDDDNGETITDRALAKNIPKDFVATRSFYSFSPAQRDLEEWYRLDVISGQKFGWVFATTPGRYGSTWSYTMKVFDPAGVQIGGTVNVGSTEGQQGITRTAAVTGTHYIQLVATPLTKSYTNIFYSLYTLTPCIMTNAVTVQSSGSNCPNSEATWSIVPDGPINSVHWDFGGACTPDSSTELNPTVTLNDAGEYTGALTIFSGCSFVTVPLSLYVGCSGGVGQMGGGGAAVTPGDIVVEPDGTSHLLGRAVATVDLDPGGQTSTFSFPAQGFFLSRLDDRGNSQIIRQVGGTAGTSITAARMDFHPSHGYAIAGFYSGTIDFNPGAGVASKNSTADGANFLLRLDSAMNFRAVSTFAGNVTIAIPALSATNGDVLLGGTFTGSVDFDPGFSAFSRTSAGGSDGFLMRYDSSNRFINGQTWGSTGSDSVRAIDVGDVGIMLGGSFTNSVDFDPGTGTAILTSTGTAAGYTLELSHTDALSYRKARNNTGAGSTVVVTGVTYVEPSGDFSGFCAELTGTASFDSPAITSNGGTDVVVVYMRDSWDSIYVNRIGGTGNDTAAAIAVHQGPANLVVTGEFRNTVDFNPGAGVDNRVAVSGADSYAFEADEEGSLTYASTWGGLSNESARCLAVDPSGVARIFGTMGSGTHDFDPGPGVETLTGLGITDAYLQRILPTGLW